MIQGAMRWTQRAAFGAAPRWFRRRAPRLRTMKKRTRPNSHPRTPGRFDTAALFAALDAERVTRGLTWADVAAQTGVSASTLTRTKFGGRLEVDGMLAMVRWLHRTVESFVIASAARGPRAR